MAYVKGAFTYVSGPLFIREFNLNSAATVKQGMPVRLNGAGDLIESQGTDSVLAGFILHDAVNSVPPGKALVAVPADGRTVFVATGNTSVTASTASSGLTLGQVKSGNSWFLIKSGSTVSAMYVVVPREDGSTLDSTDSSVFVQVIGNIATPFALQLINPIP